ncbi:uncharacterized protein LOC110417109 isoform X2 [Herrania umbratica]|uniref:Uncharacterized protein LOC110417109 isoform X2 n=1 Tax=Herrania umbratica TaxID=108875 RepID=A0A6J1ADU1_9ROSI|nr:uncharacterized protein LOC110417109 isoform X2 [Herrania umbratica]
MSHRRTHTNRQEGDSRSNFPKTQKKLIPKSQNQNKNQTPNPTTSLSSSLRQSLPKQRDAPPSGSPAAPSGSASIRVRMGENGDWVPNRGTPSTHDGNFVNYLPQDEAVAAGLGAEEGGLDPVESQRVVDLLNRELSRLLKLSPREFWKQVSGDTSLHKFLDSFLQFRSRWYDFPHRGVKGIVAGVIVGEFELSRRVLMVLYRISSNRDPAARAADSLNANDHAGEEVAQLAEVVGHLCYIWS